MGMPALQLNSNGRIALDVERLGRVHLELKSPTGNHQRPPSLLVYITVPCPPHDNTLPAKALNVCHYRHGFPMPVIAGIYKDTLMLLTRLTEREVSAAQIETAIHFLASQMARLNS